MCGSGGGLGCSSRLGVAGFVLGAVIGADGGAASLRLASSSLARQHFLYFFPLPQGQGSLRPMFIDYLRLNYLACDRARETRLFVSAAIIAHSIQAGNQSLLQPRLAQLIRHHLLTSKLISIPCSRAHASIVSRWR